MAHTVEDDERNQTKLGFDEIREEPIVQEGNLQVNNAICNICFIRTLSSVGANIALYLCYMCETYLCQGCFKGHESHRFIKKSEKGGMNKCFLEEMRNESESEREEILDREGVSLIDRINVKHELDTSSCYISGLCGLNNTRWVACDSGNDCIKIFSVSSNILQRYIRVGSDTWDVTEINVKKEPTEQSVMSASDICVTDHEEPGKQCMLAVTLPFQYKILFINVTNNPAVITKSIETMEQCFSIDFSEDKVFVVCGDYWTGAFWFVSVISTDGVTIKHISTDLHTFRSIPYISVCPGRIFITNRDNDKIICLNDEGRVISHNTIDDSWPLGISVDPDTNKVYICAGLHSKIYQFDLSLNDNETEFLFDFKSLNLGWLWALCLYRDRLYVGHCMISTDKNFVNVVRVL